MEASNDTPLSVGGADNEGASSWSDEDLFKQCPPTEECPICMLPQPLDEGETNYQACCGKLICIGCSCAVKSGKDNQILCPFCRTPAPSSDGEWMERIKQRAEGNDKEAIYNLGCCYNYGRYGLRRNQRKAMKLYLRAGELGHVGAYCNIAVAYRDGEGMVRDEKKAKHYYELAAMGGDVNARHNLGILEYNAGNMNRAVRHLMISAGAGYDQSLTGIRECFQNGHATKDDFEKALRAHEEAKDEIKSEQRDAAAATRGETNYQPNFL